jgi:hypothetical protein
MTYGPYQDLEEPDGTLDNANWYSYRYLNDQCPAWPGLLASTNRERSKLITIIQDVSTLLYGSGGVPLSAKVILQCYNRFVIWRAELPNSIGNVEHGGSKALPHVLSLL